MILSNVRKNNRIRIERSGQTKLVVRKKCCSTPMNKQVRKPFFFLNIFLVFFSSLSLQVLLLFIYRIGNRHPISIHFVNWFRQAYDKGPCWSCKWKTQGFGRVLRFLLLPFFGWCCCHENHQGFRLTTVFIASTIRSKTSTEKHIK